MCAGQGDGVRAEVDHAEHVVAGGTRLYVVVGVGEPRERLAAQAGFGAADREHRPVERQHRVGIVVLRLDGPLAPVRPVGAATAGRRRTRRTARPWSTAGAPGSRRGRGRRRPSGSAWGPAARPAAGPRPRAGPARRPGRRRATPGSAPVSSAAARARRCATARSVGVPNRRAAKPNELSARPYRVAARVTSWLDSTHVAGAPTGRWASNVDSMAARSSRGVPRPHHEVEVEGRVHLVRAQVPREPLLVGEPDLADQHPRVGVGVGDRAPRPVDVVQLVAVEERVLAGRVLATRVGERGVLDRHGGRVDAHAGHAAVEPEPQHVLVLAPHVGVVPVQVGLLGREQVQVPLAGGAVRVGRPGPGAAGEAGLPVGRRQLTVLAAAGPEPEPLALRGSRAGGERGAEPLVLVGDVVGHDVDDRADAERGRLGDEPLCLVDRAEGRVDHAVVGDVVAAVGERGGVPRGEPDGVHAERRQVGQPRPDAGEVAGAVAVPVGEAARVDLVDHGVAPPCRAGRGHGGGRGERGAHWAPRAVTFARFAPLDSRRFSATPDVR